MKRWLVRICVFLVLGAIVNVAVAWGLAAFVEPLGSHVIHVYASQPIEPNSNDDLLWIVDRSTMPGTTRISAFSGKLDGTRLPLASTITPSWLDLRDLLEGEGGWSRNVAASGLPAKALWSRQDYHRSDSDHRVVSGMDIGSYRSSSLRRILPLRPIWPGFAINTVFYAFILWLLFAAPFALRRRRRIKRGLCPKCAYPVGTWGGEVCTECGAAVGAKPQRGAATTAQGNALGIDHA